MKQIELTSKLVLAIIALTSVSAILVPTYAAPSIRSADIVNGEVRTDDLANGAVTGLKISDTNGVRSADIVNGEVKAEDIAAGVIPSGGIQPTVHIVEGNTIIIQPGQPGNSVADCPEGEILTGGGWSGQAGAEVRTNAPVDDDNTWRVLADNTSTIGQSLQAYVVCLDFSP